MIVDGLGDPQLAALLGLDRACDSANVDLAEREHPDAALLLCPVSVDGTRVDAGAAAASLSAVGAELVTIAERSIWEGNTNALSSGHTACDAIDAVAEATLVTMPAS